MTGRRKLKYRLFLYSDYSTGPFVYGRMFIPDLAQDYRYQYASSDAPPVFNVLPSRATLASK